jgi:hypothetical protein
VFTGSHRASAELSAYHNLFMLYLCYLHIAEGNPSNFEQLKVNRPNTINIGEAICAEGMNTVTFSAKAGPVAGDVIQMSKEFHKFWDPINGNQTVTVPCRPLSAVLEQHGITHIDFFRYDSSHASCTMRMCPEHLR